jgi:hypothetical protein
MVAIAPSTSCHDGVLRVWEVGVVMVMVEAKDDTYDQVALDVQYKSCKLSCDRRARVRLSVVTLLR